MEDKQLMSIKECMAYLGISRPLLMKLLDEGLPHLKFGSIYKIPKVELIEYLDQKMNCASK